MQIPDCTELIRIVSGAIVNNRKIKFCFCLTILIGPFLEMSRKFCVRDYVNAINPSDGGQIIQHIFDHRLARDWQQWLWLGKGEWIQSSGITSGEDNDFHI